MGRFFNTTGPCNPERHFMLPPEDRLVGAQLHRYIKDELYWMLHAPRQTGKTTFLRSWMRKLNASDNYIACYVSVEEAQGKTQATVAIPIICDAIKAYASRANIPIPTTDEVMPETMLSNIMCNWAKICDPKPLVVLFDEVDVLEGDAMVSFLRQLRSGFADKGVGKFPISVALVGLRDLRDYLVSAKDGVPINPGSPFNIKKDSATLSNFSKENIEKLFAQRTEETGQKITAEAMDYVWEQSQGQPWLVNSFFDRATTRALDDEDYSTVQLKHVREARKQMIEGRETHLDSLYYRLQDPRVREVIETIVSGEQNLNISLDNPEVQLTMDLGLVKFSEDKMLTFANPMYAEIMTRMINSAMQIMMPPRSDFKWQKEDGSLDMDSMLKEFQGFWRRHSEIWEEKSDYTEAFPHLLLMAFLQRILNGGGDIDRDAAAGSGRMDLYVKYNDYRCVIEIKLFRDYDSFKTLKEKALIQTLRYRDRFDKNTPAYLIIFDRRSEDKKADWDSRITWEVDNDNGITVIGV
ncbi:MAG: AAA-like domain-containing protein [Bacteroidales bacterium]|jgi:type II secretory pathway predicted ATPase ExeA|nr:AAA-like domain-containing protein [Bacteroidales bacterium]